MPRVPGNTLSDAAASRVKARQAYSAPLNIPSAGSALAAGAGALGDAARVAGAEARLVAEDGRRRAQDEAAKWRARANAVAGVGQAALDWDRALERVAEDETTRIRTWFRNEGMNLTEGKATTNPDGSVTREDGTFAKANDYTRADPKSGATQATAEKMEELRQEAMKRASSSRTRRKLEERLGDDADHFLRKAMALDAAAGKREELATRVNDAESWRQSTLVALAPDSFQMGANGPEDEKAYESLQNYMTAAAGAAMAKAGITPANGDWNQPEWATEEQRKAFENARAEAGKKITAELVATYADAMTNADDEGKMEEYGRVAEFLAGAFGEGSPTADPALKEKAKREIREGRSGFEARREREWNEIAQDARTLGAALKGGMFDGSEEAQQALADAAARKEMPKRQIDLMMAGLAEARSKGVEGVFMRSFEDEYAKLARDDAAGAYRLIEKYSAEAEKITDPAAKLAAREFLDKMRDPYERAQLKAEKEARDLNKATLLDIIEYGVAYNRDGKTFHAVSLDEVYGMIEAWEKNGLIDSGQRSQVMEKWNAKKRNGDAAAPKPTAELALWFLNAAAQASPDPEYVLGLFATDPKSNEIVAAEDDTSFWRSSEANERKKAIQQAVAESLNSLMKMQAENPRQKVSQEQINGMVKRLVESAAFTRPATEDNWHNVMNLQREIEVSRGVNRMRRDKGDAE